MPMPEIQALACILLLKLQDFRRFAQLARSLITIWQAHAAAGALICVFPAQFTPR